MSLSSAHAAMSDQRKTALRRNYETTKLERDAMALAYSKNGSATAGNVNLQQFDWKLERLKQELIAVGEIVDGGNDVRESAAVSGSVEREAHAPERPVVRGKRRPRG